MKLALIIAVLLSLNAVALDTSKVDLDIVQKNPGDFGTQIFTLYYGKCESKKEFSPKEYQEHTERDKKSNKITKIQKWMHESLQNMASGTKCN